MPFAAPGTVSLGTFQAELAAARPAPPSAAAARQPQAAKYYRLSPGKEVRLRNAYFITAQSVVKDAAGNVVEVHCTYDPASRGGNSPDGRKVKSTIHWVSVPHALNAEVRLYDKLFTKPDPSDVPEGAFDPKCSMKR